MPPVLRFDRATLRKPTKTGDGRMRADAHVARTGVQTYRDADGTLRREYRPESEVFSAEALDSYDMAPLTDDHPEGEITAANARNHAIGAVTAPRRDGDWVAIGIGVFDAKTVKKVESGKAELSSGYLCDYDPTPGVTPSGEAYDGVQRNIRINHVAIVDAARAGHQARIRMDAAIQVDNDDNRSSTMDPALIKALVDVNTANARADKAEAALVAANSRADKAEGERDANKSRLDALEKARKDESDGIGKRVQARVSLERVAAATLTEDDVKRLDKMTDREVKVAVIKRVDAIDIEPTRTDDYVEGFYASAASRAQAGAADNAHARGAVGAVPDRRVDAEEVAREKWKTDSAKMWQQDLNPKHGN